MNELPKPGVIGIAAAPEPAIPLPGMRLESVEVLGWGTFDKRVWRFDLNGDNALLTGNIGSGKSTLVDAITTLLVPAQKISYNKAAGAETRERNLRSYVLGYYKAERGDVSLSAKPKGLREPRHAFSVILGRFHNSGYDENVTLAQVFYFKDPSGQPERFYIVADSRLSIEEHFSDFGRDITKLKKKLKKLERLELFDSFPPYGAAFRRRCGIASEQALDLFLQTVSMKQVGDLTEFVRNHMLEPFPVRGRIEEMLAHFADLTSAHEAVLKARDQIERLTPIVADCDRHEEIAKEVARLRTLRDALRPYFGKLKCELLDHRIAELDAELARLGEKIGRLSTTVRERESARDDIRQAIHENGGHRISNLEREIAGKRAAAEQCRRRANDYAEPARELGLDIPRDGGQFVTNQSRIQSSLSEQAAREADLQNDLIESQVEFRALKAKHDEIEAEITSLKSRRSNIPLRMLGIRSRLIEALGLDEESLPFAGELIEVREEEAAWEGAAERVVRSFALSLLVHDRHYDDVSHWVNETHLNGRLVYLRLPAEAPALRHRSGPKSLAAKLRINHESPLFGWIAREIDERFDHVCCEEIDAFRRETKAITRTGQIKEKGGRHLKDDRSRIDDRTNFVLGWSNGAKIAALEAEAETQATQGRTLAAAISNLQQERREVAARKAHLQKLSAFTSFTDLDWQSIAIETERLEDERRQLAKGSDVLKNLKAQLESTLADLGDATTRLDKEKDKRSKSQERLSYALERRVQAAEDLDQIPEGDRPDLFAALDVVRAEFLGDQPMTINTWDARERTMRDQLGAKIDSEDKRIGRLREKIVGAMRDYAHAYSEETRDVDASPEAAPEYHGMLTSLTSDGLPRFERRFKELLNENAIREIASFSSKLRVEASDIEERIETINASMHEIDYNPGRYIALNAERTLDGEIRDFQQDFKKCTESALSGGDETAYSESKFLEVKRIMERFRGRDGETERDRRWTRKVTDVRNWFVFSATERFRSDDSEHEHYSDSGGKSGGQKEKLAYTVLAASLAYQFKLERDTERSRAFHFVMIDEAFGRGSDESAEYALELFKKMGLQLLIATPLQKIHVIEPYVAAVGFVHNEDGQRSMLRNLTIEEYRAERELSRATGARLTGS